MSDVIAQSQAGTIEKIPNLKKRQRAVYYQPVAKADGTMEWQPTRPLPSDATGRELYLSKGFRLSIPKTTDTATPEPVIDTEKETLLAENEKLRKQLQMANARAARKPS